MTRLQRLLAITISLLGGLCSIGIEGSSRLHFSNRSATINLMSGSKFTISNAITGFDGTLVKNAGATIAGSTITFDHGLFEQGWNSVTLDGVFNPTTNKLVLGGSKTLQVAPGIMVNGISVGGTGNRLEGQPSLSGAIEFDASATLTVAISTPLNQNIQFNGTSNTLRLESDLSLVDDVTVVNDGSIDVNGRRFSFGGKELTLTNDITWLNAGDIELHERMNLSGTWDFDDDATLQGNGNVLDVSGGGVLDIAAGKTLHIADVVITGVTNSTFVFGSSTSGVRLSNVTIQIDGNISLSQGLFYVEGPSTFVLHEHNWTFGTDSKLTVDSVTLWLDKAGEATMGDIYLDSAGNYEFINSGTYMEEGSGGSGGPLEAWVEATSNAVVILDGRLDTAESDISTNASDISTNQGNISTNQTNISSNANNIATNLTTINNNLDFIKFIHGPKDFTFSTNTTLSVDLFLSNDHIITVDSDITLDGDNHTVVFTKNDTSVLNVGGNALTLQNVTLENFSPSAISLTTGSVTFGDGTILQMVKNCALTSSNYTMSCSGYVELHCFGNELDVSQLEHAIEILPGGTLAIHHGRISGLGANTNNVRCVGADSTLTLSSCELVMSNDYSFTQGAIDLYQDNAIKGAHTFAYQSPQDLTIHSYAKLLIDREVTFSYDSVAANKEKLVMEDATAILHLNKCTLYSTGTGLKLQMGRILVEDLVTIRNEAQVVGEAMEISQAMPIDVLAGATFDVVEGLILYE